MSSISPEVYFEDLSSTFITIGNILSFHFEAVEYLLDLSTCCMEKMMIGIILIIIEFNGIKQLIMIGNNQNSTVFFEVLQLTIDACLYSYNRKDEIKLKTQLV